MYIQFYDFIIISNSKFEKLPWLKNAILKFAYKGYIDLWGTTLRNMYIQYYDFIIIGNSKFEKLPRLKNAILKFAYKGFIDLWGTTLLLYYTKCSMLLYNLKVRHTFLSP